ncbi:MAG: 5'-methylthioadenosine/S-adenosylhomocysteine nucleosidase [Treponema sp.]|jgi:adenosylhomocysteine nucleosidase|nr:5'-methylthioadenosine/S-adenosylhomocysteine nucleosidase [Treponema sp.]
MIGVICAMEDELSLLCETMGKYITQKIGEFEFHTGKIEGKDVTLLRCGIGKVNAAIGCALLIQRFKPGFVINSGSAGGINPELNVGDAIISTGLVYHDVDVTAFNYAPGQLPGQPQIFTVDEVYIKLAEDAVNQLKQENILPGSFNQLRGLIGTGDIFMHEPERIENVRRLFPGLTSVEMEGAAIAHCCRLFSVPVLVIRALSDIAGTESPMKFEEFLPIASKHSAQIVIRIIRNK